MYRSSNFSCHWVRTRAGSRFYRWDGASGGRGRDDVDRSVEGSHRPRSRQHHRRRRPGRRLAADRLQRGQRPRRVQRGDPVEGAAGHRRDRLQAQPGRPPAPHEPCPPHRLPAAHRTLRPAQPLHAAVPQGCRRGGETTGSQPDRLRVRRRGRSHLPVLGAQRRGRRLRLRPGGPRRLPDQGAGRAGRALLGDGAHRRVRGAELGGHRQPVRDDEPGRLPRRQGASAVRVRRQRRLRALGRRPRRRRSRTGSRSTVSSCHRGRCCARATTRSWATSSTRC